jgi:thiol-disulfide isomerase/thioredoxin
VLLALASTAAADDREALKPIVDKALQAAGGEKLLALKGWSFTEKSSSTDGKAAIYRRYARLPDCFRHDLELVPDNKNGTVLIVNGNKGWSLFQGDVSELRPDGIALQKQEYFWFAAAILGPRLLADSESVLTKLPDATLGDRTAAVIKMDRKEYGSHRLYLDKETGRLLKVARDFKKLDGKMDTSEWIFSDFRPDQGLTLPHKKKNRVGSRESAEWDLEYQLAAVPDAKRFAKPEGVKRPEFVDKFLSIRGEMEAVEAKAIAALQAADDRDAALTRFGREWTKTATPAAEKVMAAVRPHAADPAAAEALVWVANELHGTALDNEAAELLTKYHLTRKETIRLAYRYSFVPMRWTEPMVRAQLAADLPEADRPDVLYTLARVNQSLSEMPKMLAAVSGEQVAMFEAMYGKETVAALRQADAAKAEAEAARLYTELGDKYGPVKRFGDTTYGELARSAVYEIRNLEVGKTAPEVEGEDTDGVKFKLSDYRGKVVLVVFWGTWCGPCMHEVPHENEIAKRLKDKPFALVGVNSDADKIRLKARMTKEGITWRSFWCGEQGTQGAIPMAWNVTTWPTTYVLDHKGVIRAKRPYGKEMDRILDRLIRETDAKK